MKQLLTYMALLTCVLFLAACQPDTQYTETTTLPTEATTLPATQPTEAQQVTEPSTTPSLSPAAENLYTVSMPVTSEATNAEDGTNVFNYEYRSMHLILQDKEVADKVIIDYLGRIEQTRPYAQQHCQLALAADHTASDFEPYLYQVHYEPMRIDQGVLSLHGHIMQIGNYAHSTKQCISANYDMVTGDVLTLGSILYHADTKNQLVDMVITALESRTELSLFEDYTDVVKRRFSQDESTYEDFYFSTNGLCFYFSPYEIAPFSSGTVVIELPYSQLAGIISDAFFPAERIHSSGDLKVLNFDSADLSSYTQFAEIIVTDGADKLLLATDDVIHNLRLSQLQWSADGNQIIQENVIFASNKLSASDAVLVDADFSGDQPIFKVSYYKNGAYTEYYIVADGGQYTLSSTC